MKYNFYDNTFTSDFWVKINEKTKSFDSFESAKNVKEKFMDNMKLHLRSDVDVSSSLSGGIDSSSIVSMMKYINRDKKFNTFSYISEGKKAKKDGLIQLMKILTQLAIRFCFGAKYTQGN